MAATESTMLELGTPLIPFSLPDVDGKIIDSDSFSTADAIVVAFICNHCPFVKHIENGLIQCAKDYEDKSVGFVAISSNDIEKYPDDSPEKMKEVSERMNYPFVYLFDPQQEVAKNYHAACTPDFFLFSKDKKLVYRGQFDDSRPGNGKPVTGKDLRNAIDLVLADKEVPADGQKPSIGCNIKWIPGNEPDYFKG